MAIKATDRVKIQSYGDELGASFTDINGSLEELVSGVAAANYEGSNAVQFKQMVVDNCITFAEQCRDAMTAMSSNVHEQTSYIAQNLGGGAIDVPAPTGAVNRPAISTDESVELADSDALTTMMSLVETQMTNIRTAFDENLGNFERLGATDGWVGEEYDTLRGQISTATADVNDNITTSSTNITSTIQSQLDALGM